MCLLIYATICYQWYRHLKKINFKYSLSEINNSAHLSYIGILALTFLIRIILIGTSHNEYTAGYVTFVETGYLVILIVSALTHNSIIKRQYQLNKVC
jgi:hypothetical protein